MSINQGYRSLSEEVYHGILFRISEGILNAGDKLPSEAQLCEMFKVSRASVRAAIQKLQGSGVVETRPGIGSFVVLPKEASKESDGKKSLTAEEFRAFFEFRQAIEFKAMELFSMRATETDYAHLLEAIQNMEACKGDLEEFTKWDLAFHLSILEGSHSQFLIEAFLNQKSTCMTYFKEINRIEAVLSWEERVEEHRKCYEALRSNRPGDAIDIFLSKNTFYYVSSFKQNH